MSRWQIPALTLTIALGASPPAEASNVGRSAGTGAGVGALVGCQHERADLLAQAGSTSSNFDHRLASLWLRAIIAVDQRQPDQATPLFEELVARDPDIDTVQQASIACDRALLDVRSERRAAGIQCEG